VVGLRPSFFVLLTWFKFTARASPKSVSFSCQSFVSSMLFGFRSLRSER